MFAFAEANSFRVAFVQGWTRLVDRRRFRFRPAAAARTSHPTAPVPTQAVDPVVLTVLAVNLLGPATFRTVSLGKAVTVKVPDAETGEIFRAALAEMQKVRPTDRLVDIVVAGEQAARSACGAGA